MRTVTINDRTLTWQNENLVSMEYKPITSQPKNDTKNSLTGEAIANMLMKQAIKNMMMNAKPNQKE